MMRKLMTLLAIAAVCCGCPALAQTNTSAAADTAVVNFVQNAAKGGMMEVASGKLAQTKGKSADVRNFGSRMVKDHGKANAQLIKLAGAKSISLPPAPGDDPMLTNSTGADFDRNYVSMMVKDHKETIALFQKAANSLSDTQLRAFARETLPVLQDHLAKIKAIASNMSISGK
jgi:putative membrane protein